MSLTCSNIIEERLWWKSIKQERRLCYLGCRGRYWRTYKKNVEGLLLSCHEMKSNYSSKDQLLPIIFLYMKLYKSSALSSSPPLLSLTRTGSSWASRHSNGINSSHLPILSGTAHSIPSLEHENAWVSQANHAESTCDFIPWHPPAY